MLNAVPANYVLGTFIGVSLLKLPFDRIPDPAWSNWWIRIMAVCLGALFALFQYWGGVDHPAGVTAYAQTIIGLRAGVEAILVYHIGTGDFLGVFDKPKIEPLMTKDPEPLVSHDLAS